MVNLSQFWASSLPNSPEFEHKLSVALSTSVCLDLWCDQSKAYPRTSVGLCVCESLLL